MAAPTLIHDPASKEDQTRVIILIIILALFIIGIVAVIALSDTNKDSENTALAQQISTEVSQGVVASLQADDHTGNMMIVVMASDDTSNDVAVTQLFGQSKDPVHADNFSGGLEIVSSATTITGTQTAETVTLREKQTNTLYIVCIGRDDNTTSIDITPVKA